MPVYPGALRIAGNSPAIGWHERIVRSRGSEISASALTFVLSFLVALSFVITANIWFYSMGKEVNKQLPKDAQIDLWMRHKMYEVLRLHAEMHPKSPKRWQMWTLVVFAAAFGVRRLRRFLVSPTLIAAKHLSIKLKRLLPSNSR
jgi:hypothetical protein